MTTVSLQNVSIRYLTGDVKSIGLKDYIIKRIRHQYSVKEIPANSNVSFSLEKGDVLGIIGTNGSGKSTILKAISGIIKPSEGTVQVNGKVAAVLELTTGFDADLTVKENIFLRGAIIGCSRNHVNQSYNEIIDFAELREFENLQFRQLSSGMKSRLAFAIVSIMHPDILVLDEVLSVGDGAFREKSMAKIRQLISGGTTTILVSHSINQINNLCNKVLWLQNGSSKEFGTDVPAICSRYEAYLAAKGKNNVQKIHQTSI